MTPFNTAASGTNSDLYLSGVGAADPLIFETTSTTVYIEGELYNNECANISVTTKNNGEKLIEDHIIVSFPNNEEILSMGRSGDRVEFYPRGSSIEGKDEIKIDSSEYPFVDLVTSGWETGQNETLNLKVNPNKGLRDVLFLVRAVLKNDSTGNYESYPKILSDADQQGWNIYKKLIDVPDSPDLRIEDVSWEPANPCENENVTFKVTLMNVGLAPSGNCSVKCYLNGNEISFSPISGLEAGSKTSFTFNWVPTSPGNMDLKVVVDSEEQFFDFSEENNEKEGIFKVTRFTTSSSSSSGSSYSSSGGACGSSEPPSNVEIKELDQQFISNYNHAKFVFAKNVTPIAYIEFDPKKTVGKTTTIVETLKEKSTLVTELPSGKVYENTNIWVETEGTASPENIENAIVGFKVEKTWINSNGVDSSSVKLWKFEDGKWIELPTSQTSEDNDYVYYEADTPGFSAFSIMALYPEDDPETYRALVNSVEDRDFRVVSEASGEKEFDVIDSEAGENNFGIFGSLKKVW
ncbi:MAG: PGF-pre-PGF domain-containing protein [Methanosarcina sp.]|uniref:PGF-pre-PGF domain-containing protein n=1 Tax=Methanosarcina sp. TaxID=2213 RepID=UPI002618E1F5|nr:PGF-pre-PGF domain-containing protein [Methanosarcina sp.]MDD3247774.1 PGF-pre-PGF domain-containing protein [Methanosarcina sp.]MDD4249936.1 PGF-pre-PGF domain-containing protein [Methanosarcina sp.]